MTAISQNLLKQPPKKTAFFTWFQVSRSHFFLPEIPSPIEDGSVITVFHVSVLAGKPNIQRLQRSMGGTVPENKRSLKEYSHL